MKKIKICAIIVAGAISVVSTGLLMLTGCSDKYYEISTFEELMSNDKKNIKLTNDIDCKNQSIKSINCSKIDGQGHIIKNAVISSPNEYSYTASLFSAETIQNITLENITVQVEKALSVAIVSGGNSKLIENVNVTNSKISCSNPIYKSNTSWNAEGFCVGGIYGGYYRETKNGAIEKSFDCKIINCSVLNTTIEVSDTPISIYSGGIAGGCNNIIGCTVKDSIIVSEVSNITSPHSGGIVGRSEGTIENSATLNTRITAVAPKYTSSIMGISSSDCYAGGIAGTIKSENAVKYCYGDGNSIYADCSGDIYVGGLIGYADKTTVTQCYVKDTYIRMEGYVKAGNLGGVSRRAGGLIGSSNNNAVTSCFVYNKQHIHEASEDVSSTNSRLGGLIGGCKELTVMNCATHNNFIGNDNKSFETDEFIPISVNGVYNCYVSDNKLGNINNCEVINDEFWSVPNTIKNKLNLTGNYWQFKISNLPYLDFN